MVHFRFLVVLLSIIHFFSLDVFMILIHSRLLVDL